MQLESVENINTSWLQVLIKPYLKKKLKGKLARSSFRRWLTFLFDIPYYRPQRSWAKVMFLQASVILSTGGWGGLPQYMLGYPPPPPKSSPPLSRPPPREADSDIRSTSGRYESYWNAFLFMIFSSDIQLTRSLHLPSITFAQKSLKVSGFCAACLTSS